MNENNQFPKKVMAVLFTITIAACTATVKVPKHPAPGEPPQPPKVEIQKD